ncbi:hypothetical protein CsSME_00018930 [Camellia sinensis var. sinensis]
MCYFAIEDHECACAGKSCIIQALEIALKHYKKAFTELATLSRTTLCCHVTPSPEAQVLFISS